MLHGIGAGGALGPGVFLAEALREQEARYLERTAPWIERVGLQHIKDRVVEDEAGRDELAERFWYSQKFSQDDPWAERASGAAREQHAHMAHFQPLALEVAE